MPTQKQLIRSRWNWQEISLFKEWQSAMTYMKGLYKSTGVACRGCSCCSSVGKRTQSLSGCAICGKEKSLNVVSASADGDKISTEIRELKDIVVGMIDKIRELERKAETTSTAQRCSELICFACREPNHFARSCPHKEGGNRSRGLPRARQSP